MTAKPPKDLPVVAEEDRPYGKSGYHGSEAKELARQAALTRDVEMTEEKFFEVCDRLIAGEPLVTVCADRAMPSQPQFMRYLYKNEKAREMYYAAQEMRMETLVELALLEATDDSNDSSEGPKGRVAHNDVVQRSRLKVDTMKWAASTMAPKRFSPKTTTELKGNPDQPVQINVSTGVPRAAGSLIGGQLAAPKVIDAVATEVKDEQI